MKCSAKQKPIKIASKHHIMHHIIYAFKIVKIIHYLSFKYLQIILIPKITAPFFLRSFIPHFFGALKKTASNINTKENITHINPIPTSPTSQTPNRILRNHIKIDTLLKQKSESKNLLTDFKYEKYQTNSRLSYLMLMIK